MSPALEAKVRGAIAQLNYRRDANASMLRRLGGKTQTIGLVLEDVANPFSSALHRAIEDTAALEACSSSLGAVTKTHFASAS